MSDGENNRDAPRVVPTNERKGVQIRNAAQFVFVPTANGAGMGCGRDVGGLWRKYHAPKDCL